MPIHLACALEIERSGDQKHRRGGRGKHPPVAAAPIDQRGHPIERRNAQQKRCRHGQDEAVVKDPSVENHLRQQDHAQRPTARFAGRNRRWAASSRRRGKKWRQRPGPSRESTAATVAQRRPNRHDRARHQRSPATTAERRRPRSPSDIVPADAAPGRAAAAGTRTQRIQAGHRQHRPSVFHRVVHPHSRRDRTADRRYRACAATTHDPSVPSRACRAGMADAKHRKATAGGMSKATRNSTTLPALGPNRDARTRAPAAAPRRRRRARQENLGFRQERQAQGQSACDRPEAGCALPDGQAATTANSDSIRPCVISCE